MTAEGSPGPRARPALKHKRLAGKVAIVTGAGSAPDEFGVGSAIAEILAAAGARLCLLDRDEARAAVTRERILADGGEAIVVAGDIVSEQDCRRCIADTVRDFQRIDILVNNVAISDRVALAELDVARWRHVLDTNVTGAMLMSKHAIPEMLRHRSGAIVNISSIAGLRAHGNLSYAASKAALVELGNNLAVLHGRDGIRVNAIAPGYLRTPMAEKSIGSRSVRQDIAPLGIEGDAWDVALATLFLASDEARFITGALLTVDGGAIISGPLTAAGFASEAGR